MNNVELNINSYIQPDPFWLNYSNEINRFAGLLVKNPFFQRMKNTTFLGILSPYFHEYTKSNSPIHLSRKYIDGNRLDHSLNMAALLINLYDSNFENIKHSDNLKEEIIRYAVVWCILHDLTTWPVSHTSEPAFENIFNTSHKEILFSMINNSKNLPREMWLGDTLADINININDILCLLKKMKPNNENLIPLYNLISSPINPDTIEGMWRASPVFMSKNRINHPIKVYSNIEVLMTNDIMIKHGKRGNLLNFWKNKSIVYKDFINKDKVVRWESSWTLAIQKSVGNIDLLESFYLDEDELIKKAKKYFSEDVTEIHRYKPPHVYPIFKEKNLKKGTPKYLNSLKSKLLAYPNFLYKDGRINQMEEKHLFESLNGNVKSETYAKIESTFNYSKTLVQNIAKIIQNYIVENKLKKENICFAVMGSIGRFEAGETSDIDIIPIFSDEGSKALFESENHNKLFRKHLREHSSRDVSKGEDITAPVTIAELIDPETIGGQKDNSNTLTRRLLLITEGVQVGGNLDLNLIKTEILKSYADQERTSGRNVLSLMNDIARYYRTLLIEFKAKIDVEDKAWGIRNAKLRHNRKFWYFSCILAFVMNDSKNESIENQIDFLIKSFNTPAYLRYSQILNKFPVEYGELLASYFWFIEFIGLKDKRALLGKVRFQNRNNMDQIDYQAVKLNSGRLHNEMISIILSLPEKYKKKLLDWFLL
ncbi:MAG: hypothetical protein ABUK01_12675 [Leptospirales bacterium]